MKILKKILMVIGLAVAIVIGLALLQPASFKLERSTVVKAKAEKVYPYLADFNKFDEWSPWAKLDSKMTKKLSGSPSGKGAIYEWAGNDDVGKGRMEILDASLSGGVKIKLIFTEPFAAINDTLQTLEPQGESTKVTWAMSGSNNFMAKVMGVFVSMDKMVGPDFEKGLANLKMLVEKN